MSDPKFLVVGFSGAGKTHYLEQKLIQGEIGQDLDRLILDKQANQFKNTRLMIQSLGLAEFRRIELATLKEWFCESNPGEYLSLGGGAIHKESLEWLNMRSDWQAIYIKKSLKQCVRGMKERGESFLLDLSSESIKELYEQRLELYKQLKNIQDS